ncbi:hypothetical protein SLEP1_g22337 [Rubroshorea leprosula]|uniref:Uncharacterized protein n=1 Tax=Rubroshorea leprosula TaxID=152421 RepID=A0AAV5JJE7_9ROSI|nr:hypothetical protein SLEP1_g22337 [Rubroshorea leprosula]
MVQGRFVVSRFQSILVRLCAVEGFVCRLQSDSSQFQMWDGVICAKPILSATWILLRHSIPAIVFFQPQLPSSVCDRRIRYLNLHSCQNHPNLANHDLPDLPFQSSCTSSYETWWHGYFQPWFLGVLDNISTLVPPPLIKKSREKGVVEESGDLESALTIHSKKPNLPRSISRIQTKRKITISTNSSEEYTPSKQQRTRGIKRSTVKPTATKKLIKSASPSESTSATETQIQPNKIEDVSPKPDHVEEKIIASDEGDSAPLPTKSGNGSSPATKSFAVDVSVVDDDLEDELLARLDMLMDPCVKSKSASDSKGKSVAKETNLDTDPPSQEQINFAILTLQELVDGDLSHFCRVPNRPAAFEAAQILSRAPHLSFAKHKFWVEFSIIYADFNNKFLALESKVAATEFVRKSVADGTAVVFKKKEEFLAAKDAHVAQIKHLHDLKEEISNLEAKLAELRSQVPLVEQMEKNLAEQWNNL